MKLTKEDLESFAAENLNLTHRAGKSTMQVLLRLARLGLQYEKVEEALLKNNPESSREMLARDRHLISLGLWAEEHAIPDLNILANNKVYGASGAMDVAEETLSKLPK